MKILNAGDLLIIERGEYSDRCWEGPVRMLVTATKEELADAFRAEWVPADEWEESPRPEDFLPWLVKTGKAEPVDNVHSWHVGCYGEFKP